VRRIIVANGGRVGKVDVAGRALPVVPAGAVASNVSSGAVPATALAASNTAVPAATRLK
jgi:hypothetical protein